GRHATRSAPATAETRTDHRGSSTHVAAARTRAPVTDETEKYRVTGSISPKAARPIAVAAGTTGRNAPAPVATPLPPRKDSHTGNMWPMTAAAAAAAGSGPSGAIARASSVAAEPLAKSSTKATTPAVLPAARITFAVPTLPL